MMNPRAIKSNAADPRTITREGGFTLPEIFISMTLFVLLMGSIVAANLYGIRWFQVVQVQLLASDLARKSIGHMADEIRGCSAVYVGTVTNGVFGACAGGQPQQGTSIIIYSSTNSTNYILYFYNGADQSFRRVTTPTGNTMILATTVTNLKIFQMQDCLGNLLTNVQNNSLIHCSLQFYSSAATNPLNNYYKIETSAAPRLWQ